MKFQIRNSILVLLIILLVSSCQDLTNPYDDAVPKDQPAINSADMIKANNNRKIIVYNDGFNLENEEAKLKARGFTHIKKLRRVNAIAAMIPDHSHSILLEDPAIARIDNDNIYTLVKKPSGTGKPNPTPPPAQTVPWGVDSVFSETVWPTNKGTAVKVAVFDTGIDTGHPDLKANVKGGYGAINNPRKYKDDHGHGTHVAGTIAAVDNSEGVVGVAPEAWLYSVKVLGANGSGRLSYIIDGLDWAISNDIQVVNMSLSSSYNDPLLEQACDDAVTAGIVIVCAAGNDGSSVQYPAKYSSTIAVSSVYVSSPGNYQINSWSNRGSEIDFAAPGYMINSTVLGDTYDEYSGTSMASPHVAGVAALTVAKYPSYSSSAIRTQMQNTADNIGLSTTYQGYGFIDAKAGQ